MSRTHAETLQSGYNGPSSNGHHSKTEARMACITHLQAGLAAGKGILSSIGGRVVLVANISV